MQKIWFYISETQPNEECSLIFGHLYQISNDSNLENDFLTKKFDNKNFICWNKKLKIDDSSAPAIMFQKYINRDSHEGIQMLYQIYLNISNNQEFQMSDSLENMSNKELFHLFIILIYLIKELKSILFFRIGESIMSILFTRDINKELYNQFKGEFKLLNNIDGQEFLFCLFFSVFFGLKINPFQYAHSFSYDSVSKFLQYIMNLSLNNNNYTNYFCALACVSFYIDPSSCIREGVIFDTQEKLDNDKIACCLLELLENNMGNKDTKNFSFAQFMQFIPCGIKKCIEEEKIMELFSIFHLNEEDKSDFCYRNNLILGYYYYCSSDPNDIKWDNIVDIINRIRNSNNNYPKSMEKMVLSYLSILFEKIDNNKKDVKNNLSYYLDLLMKYETIVENNSYLENIIKSKINNDKSVFFEIIIESPNIFDNILDKYDIGDIITPDCISKMLKIDYYDKDFMDKLSFMYITELKNKIECAEKYMIKYKNEELSKQIIELKCFLTKIKRFIKYVIEKSQSEDYKFPHVCSPNDLLNYSFPPELSAQVT